MRWLTVLGILAVSAGGMLAGAGIAHAAMRSKGPDPVLAQAADIVVGEAGGSGSLVSLTDKAYWRARPRCPRRLDPDDPSHAACIRDWLVLRDLVAARMPPPDIERPGDDLPQEGPAADLRGWLGSLSSQQRTELRLLIGARHYDAIATAAASGDDDGTVRAVLTLKAEIETLADEHPIEAMRRYSDLKSLLGDKFDDLVRLAEKYKAYA